MSIQRRKSNIVRKLEIEHSSGAGLGEKPAEVKHAAVHPVVDGKDCHLMMKMTRTRKQSCLTSTLTRLRDQDSSNNSRRHGMTTQQYFRMAVSSGPQRTLKRFFTGDSC